VFIEKPITLSMQSAQRIIDAEKKSKGRVWVGYMRRHSRTFTDAFKRELDSIPKILYARSRDFSGRMSISSALTCPCAEVCHSYPTLTT
jgi:predicted dehydrogenase